MADAARGHSAATLFEASGLECACDRAVRAAWPGARVAGPAFTVQGAAGDNLALHRAAVAAPAGSVLVADVRGAANGHWGEILTVAAQQRGIAGLVIDGGVRDIEGLQRLEFPVFSRNNTVRGTSKTHPGRFSEPVRVGGIIVGPGDLIVGDTDGVVALAALRASQILDAADARVAAEKRAIEALRHGATTLEYYHLDRGPAGAGTLR
jgi:4-hydroxy-4-methyl-2-oxoglutarate aldolase